MKLLIVYPVFILSLILTKRTLTLFWAAKHLSKPLISQSPLLLKMVMSHKWKLLGKATDKTAEVKLTQPEQHTLLIFLCNFGLVHGCDGWSCSNYSRTKSNFKEEATLD